MAAIGTLGSYSYPSLESDVTISSSSRVMLPFYYETQKKNACHYGESQDHVKPVRRDWSVTPTSLGALSWGVPS